MSDKKLILLVDDDPIFIETTKIVLENDYEIETASDGTECFAKLSEKKPDLIILDVMMKHLGEGVDVAAKIRDDEKTKEIPIIMLTGVSKVYDMSTMVDHSMYQKSDLWLEKPVEPEQLMEEIKKLIG